MARRVRDATLDSRAARNKLQIRAEPHWRALDQGVHLGYRSRKQGGSWTARRRTEAGTYLEAKIGLADDFADADGVAIFSFSQAQEMARDWSKTEARREQGLEPYEVGPYTVAHAIEDYLTSYGRRGRSLNVTKSYAFAHIVPDLGDVQLARLTPGMLRKWHEDLAHRPARLRARRGDEPKLRKAESDSETKRRRRATANRVLTIFKAALNHAWQEGKARSDEAWRKVKPFRNVDLPVIRYLTENESVRLVNASASEFKPLVKGALLTGCRYGELTVLRAMDFNAQTGTLTIRTSKSGRPRHVTLTTEGQRLFADLTAGKARDALIFSRKNGEAWGKSHQQRPLAEACKRARIMPAISFHVLRHTHGSTLAMRGAPLPVIARQLGHADTRMTERHYAHLAPNYVADTIRASFPDLGIVQLGNVRPLAKRGSRANHDT